VAERTIYARPEFARMMNAWFVNIKVDREQRPDLDRIHMLATQIMTGKGGWPNNLFLTPDLKPFFAGSYFPPHDDEFGRKGFSSILRSIHRKWTAEPGPLKDAAQRVHMALRDYERHAAGGPSGEVHPEAWLSQAAASLARLADRQRGGFASGGGTKFPRAPFLELLLAHHRILRDAASLEMLTAALDAMAYGGIRDHLGGGFHRYSTEPSWSVPHFEKMLYDNAQLLRIYAEAFALTGKALYRDTATDIGNYLQRQMTAPEGGFYTAEDAEVNGREGASYVWSRPQIVAILGSQGAEKFFKVYTLTALPPGALQSDDEALSEDPAGVIRVRLPIGRTLPGAKSGDAAPPLAEMQPLRVKLLEARKRRPQPLRDDKIVVGLNGLAIEAFAEAGRILARPEYVSIARRAGEYLWGVAYDAQSASLRHEIFRGRAQTPGFLDDYALLARGYLSLNGATGEPVWRERAAKLADAILTRFARADGTLMTSEREGELLIAPVDDGDSAYPSGTSAAVEVFLRLAGATSNAQYASAATRIVRRLGDRLANEAGAWSTMVVALNANRLDPKTAALPSGSTAAVAGLLPPDTRDHVRLSAKAVQQADHYRIEITVKIDAGYHINANPASFDYLIPTSVSFDGVTPASITYPEPVLFKPRFARGGIKVYEGNPTLTARIAKRDAGNRNSIRATVVAQACNAEICLPPSKLEITIPTADGR